MFLLPWDDFGDQGEKMLRCVHSEDRKGSTNHVGPLLEPPESECP